MPLIDFRTDLTTLKYGADRPGGGWSGQPYIQSPNPSLPPTVTTEAFDLFNNFYTANKTTRDYPLRGGASSNLQTPAGRIDRARIQAFLNDKAAGTIFKLKQQGLQLSNPNIQTSTVIGVSEQLPILETTRVFSPNADNLLLQTQVQGLGIHIPRHGLSPLLAVPYQSTYEYVATRNNTENSNRLSVLTTLKIKNELVRRNRGRSNRTQINNPILLGFANRYGISPLSNQILNYGGGPGSVYGVGFTIINRTSDTTQAHEQAVQFYNALTLTYSQLANQNTRDNNGRAKFAPNIQDFRSNFSGSTAVADYVGISRWYNRSVTGDPGRVPSANRVDYSKSTVLGIDRVNAQNPFYYDQSKQPFWEVNDVDTSDIIKFGFECLSNDSPNDAVALVFRAYLTSFSDNHQAELNSFKYLGRGETFRTYQGFDRAISFGFKIAAHSRDEMRPLYKKLNHLISQIYPDYSSEGFMRGSVVKLTIGDYIYRVPGFLESVNISIDGNTSWEIALDSNGVDSDMNQVPQIVDVQCSFKPIHGFLPRRETLVDSFVPLIGSVASDGKDGWLSTPVEYKKELELVTAARPTLTPPLPPTNLPTTLPTITPNPTLQPPTQGTGTGRRRRGR